MVNGVPYRVADDGAPGDRHEADRHGGEERPALQRGRCPPDQIGEDEGRAAREREPGLRIPHQGSSAVLVFVVVDAFPGVFGTVA